MKILSGLLAIIVFSVAIFTSIYFKAPYNFASQYFSELGTGQYSYIFNFGLVATSLLLLVFFIEIRKISKLGFAFGALSCLFLIGISFYTGGHPYHVALTTMFFLSILLASIFVSLSIKSASVKILNILLILATTLFSYIYFIGNESQILQKVVIFGYFIWIILVSVKHEIGMEEMPNV